MNRWMIAGVLAGACTVQPGQKVSARIIDISVDCSEPAEGEASTGFIVLADEGDLFMAEVLDTRSGRVLSVPYEREGREVTFFCFDGMSAFNLKLIEVLNQSEAPADPNGGTAEPPAL